MSVYVPSRASLLTAPGDKAVEDTKWVAGDCGRGISQILEGPLSVAAFRPEHGAWQR